MRAETVGLGFSQVNVFSSDPLGGNPLAVVHDARDLTDVQMQNFARWTNLSETTYLLPTSNWNADYRVRIFTPSRELPFAGHPTLGSSHAWLSAGGKPRQPGIVVQECGAGLVQLRQSDQLLEFSAPPLLRAGPLEPEIARQICAAPSIDESDIMAHQWADNGPGWCAVMLHTSHHVLALEPDWALLAPLNLGVVGAHDPRCDAAFEVRAFIGAAGFEDPVTGSLNASLAQWLIGAGLAEDSYVATQGTALARSGRVSLKKESGEIWVGGRTIEVISGTMCLQC